MAIPRMHATLCRCCWQLLTEDSENSDRSLHRLSQYYVSSNNLQRCNTTIYRMHSLPTTASNGNSQVHELLQRKSTRSHHHYRRRRDNYSTDLWTTGLSVHRIQFIHTQTLHCFIQLRRFIYGICTTLRSITQIIRYGTQFAWRYVCVKNYTNLQE